jgi:hypothetical protein
MWHFNTGNNIRGVMLITQVKESTAMGVKATWKLGCKRASPLFMVAI